jgi:hypothetical protein
MHQFKLYLFKMPHAVKKTETVNVSILTVKRYQLEIVLLQGDRFTKWQIYSCE